MAMLNDSYNTLFQNNCEFIINTKDQTVSVWTIKEIKSGEELFTSYGDDYWK
jgi:SET domain-containing protein